MFQDVVAGDMKLILTQLRLIVARGIYLLFQWISANKNIG